MRLTDLDAVSGSIDRSKTIEICRQLIRTRSINPPGSERQIAEYAAGVLAEIGLEVEIIVHDEDRASVLARLTGYGETPGLLYSAHLDTVPAGEQAWSHDPFEARLVDGKIWGRGASDMKAGMAAMIGAAEAIVRTDTPLRGDLILALSAGEEVDSLGAAVLAERLKDEPLQLLVISEPSSNEIYIAEKGALWLELTTHGKTAHGAAPHMGRNAITMMLRLLQEFERLAVPFTAHPLLGEFTCSINTIHGGVKTNVVPDRCISTLDMRTVPGQGHGMIVQQAAGVIERLSRSVPGFRADFRVTNNRAPVLSSPDEPAVARFLSVVKHVTGHTPQPGGVHYYTDAATYVPALGIQMVICGPGDPALAHQPDEYVEVDKLIEATRIFTRAALSLLGE
jgi:succinyl-diaminopimelate desuccinylase